MTGQNESTVTNLPAPDKGTGSHSPEFLAGGGEMGERIRSMDWANTPLGPVEQWPQSLKTAVRIILTSRQPMFVWWGKELLNLYNDPYKSIVGGKHPEALGQPAAYVWREIWNQVGPRAEKAMLQNEGTYDEALLLIMERNGYPEETYYTFSYSPIPADTGGTGGIICANTDDTQRIVGERQLKLLRELAAATAEAKTLDEACSLSAFYLGHNPYDLPFSLIYLFDQQERAFQLSGLSGIERNHPATVERVRFDENSFWHLSEVLSTNKPVFISDLTKTFTNLPTGAWQRSPYQAIALPIIGSGKTGKSGVLIIGLNPFRLFDESYAGFVDLVASQIAASIANAQSYEEERKRAEALAEIDRAKTVFFSNVSHEFRTPLTLMLGPIEDMLSETDSSQSSYQRERLEVLHRNSLRLLKLVNTLLDFSRIEAGRIQAQYAPTDLSIYTSDLASSFRSATEKAGLKLIVNCPPLRELVYVDQDMWEKIVLNLLSNAFKYTLHGNITVSLSQVGNNVELCVEDTGVGIPKQEIFHIFERFHRVTGSQGRTYEGSGIGLSLVQELVKLHGGSISVRSEEGVGSTFTVSLPLGTKHLPKERILHKQLLPSTATETNPFIEEALSWLPFNSSQNQSNGVSYLPEDYATNTSTVQSSYQTLSRFKVLLVDDNSDMRDYVSKLLAKRYEVIAVENGRIALNLIEANRPDLIITDVMMPELDGFGLIQELRANPITNPIPVIMLSARAGEEAQIEGLEAGADDYIVKPFSARELLARVGSRLEIAQIRMKTEEVQKFLTDATSVLSSSLDFNTTLENMARVVVPYLADWCTVDIVHNFNSLPPGKTVLVQAALAHIDPYKEQLVRKLRDNLLLPYANENSSMMQSFESGQPILIPQIPDESIDLVTDNLEARRILRELKLVSALHVPLIARGRKLGVLTLNTSYRRVLSQKDVELTQELARRAALALDNSFLYEQMQRAVQLRNEFLSVAAHELKTPITAIKGFSQLITRQLIKTGTVEQNRLQQLLDVLNSQSNKLTTLIEQLLDVSRLEAGKMSLNLKLTDIVLLVNNLATTTKTMLTDPVKHQLTVHFSPELSDSFMVLIDPIRFEQVLTNLVGNAIKYSPDGGPIKIEASLLDENTFRIAITDKGLGVPVEHRAHLFERFYQAHEDSYTSGMGLGLYISRQIIELHGGTIEVEFPTDAGSSFIVLVPVGN